MKKKKKLQIILFVICALIFCNIVYFFATSWQNFFPTKTSLSGGEAGWKTYSDSKLGFEVKYPPTWIVQDSSDIFTINPEGEAVSNPFFTVTERNDFKSLDDIKKTLATDVPITSIQVGDASGFEYNDGGDHEAVWLSHLSQIYLIRMYLSPYWGDEVNQILATFNFTN